MSKYRTLEVNVISAEELCINRRQPVRKNAFVIVRKDNLSEVGITNIDSEGGSYPAWNQKFVIETPMYAKFFLLEVQCKSFSGDHIIGSAKVPVSDFTGDYFPGNYLHFLSYPLRDKHGEKNGIINLSVRVKSSENDKNVVNYSKPMMPAPACGKLAHHQEVAMGYPIR